MKLKWNLVSKGMRPHAQLQTKLEQKIDIVSAAEGTDERIIIRYHHYNALYEAILRQTNNRWVITSLKIIKSYGNG